MYNEFDDKENLETGNSPKTGNMPENSSVEGANQQNETDYMKQNNTDMAGREDEQGYHSNTSYTQSSKEEENRMQDTSHKEGPTESFYHYSYDRQSGNKEKEHTYGNYEPGREREPLIYEQPKKKKGLAPKLVAAASVALVFGVVASAAFQATGYVGGKLFPDTQQTETKISSTGIVNNTAKGEAVSTGSTDVSLVAQNAMPSIVSITNKTVTEVQNYFFGGSQQQEEESSGSGIIVAKNDKELLIATNNHVVENAENLAVCFTVDVENQEEKVVTAQVKGTDPEHDLAVIAVQLSDIPSEVLGQIKIAEMGDSDGLQVGQQAIAIGNALGYGQSLTSGVISALDREVTVQTTTGDVTNNLIQTDAAINFGNSGGALLNISGQLIGINSVKAASTGVEGMGYAIPINTAKPILDDLMNRTTRTKVDTDKLGFMGVTPVDVSEEAKQVYNMPSGAFVYQVQEDSAAEKAGLIKGDIITKIDGITISSASELLNRMQYYKSGETIELQVQAAEGGEYKERTVKITLDKKPADTQTQENQEDNGLSQDQNGGFIPDGSNGGSTIPNDFFQYGN